MRLLQSDLQDFHLVHFTACYFDSQGRAELATTRMLLSCLQQSIPVHIARLPAGLLSTDVKSCKSLKPTLITAERKSQRQFSSPGPRYIFYDSSLRKSRILRLNNNKKPSQSQTAAFNFIANHASSNDQKRCIAHSINTGTSLPSSFRVAPQLLITSLYHPSFSQIARSNYFSQAKGGKDMSSSGFAARAQAAGDRANNAASGGYQNSGSGSQGGNTGAGNGTQGGFGKK